MNKPASDYDAILMVIGSASDLSFERARTSAQQVKWIAELNPAASLSLHMDGYDDDPRELFQIPEAAIFIAEFAAELHSLGLPPRFAERLAPESIKWQAVTVQR